MATSFFPIEFESAEVLQYARGLGTKVQYYNGENQVFILNENTLRSNGRIFQDNGYNGQWVTTNYSIENDQLTDISKICFDHPSNGNLYFSIGTKIFCYQYAKNISPYITSWDYSMKNDSSICQLNIEVQNIRAEWFYTEYSLFQPGANIGLKLHFGNSDGITLCNTWVDECSYDIAQETVSISCRNVSGFFLKDQIVYELPIMPEDRSISDIIRGLLYEAGLDSNMYLVEELYSEDITSEDVISSIDLSSTILDSITDILAHFEESAILEDGEGKIYVGTKEWLSTYFPNGIFVFDEGSDIYSRKTSKARDAAYRFIVTKGSYTGEDSSESFDWESEPAKINHYSQWYLGIRKIHYIDAPSNITREEIDSYNESRAKEFHYIGIAEDITMPIHPEVLIGDVGAVKQSDDEAIKLGLINEVTHSFTKDKGFQTHIAIDSGGDYSDRGANIYSQSAKIFGYNRRQNIVDILRMAINASKDKFKNG